jgi:hypothetical protein
MGDRDEMSLIVRVWRGPGPGALRASVTDAASFQRRYFDQAEEMIVFLRALIAESTEPVQEITPADHPGG